MAEAGSVDVIIRATNDIFLAGLSEAQAALFAFAKEAAKGLQEAVLQFGKAEQATVKLAQALRGQGVVSRAVLDDLERYAAGLEATSTFSQRAIMDAEGMLITFGLTGQVLKDTTRAALDLSARFGIDLVQAADLLGKTAQGETARLQKFGIIIDQSTPKSQKLGEALRQISTYMGGSAAAETTEFLGKLDQLKVVMEHIAENVGEGIAPFLKTILDDIKNNKEAVLQFAKDLGTAIGDMLEDIRAIASYVDKLNIAARMRQWAASVVPGIGSAVGKGVGGLLYGEGGAALGGAAGGLMAPGLLGQVGGTGAYGASGGPVFPGLGSGGGAAAPKGGMPGAGQGGPRGLVNEWKEAFTKIKNEATSLTAVIGEIMGGIQSTLSTGFQSFFVEMANGGKNFGDVMKGIMMSFRDLTFKIISDLLARWITAHLAEMMIKKQAAVQAIAMNTAEAQSGAVAANARIPFIGIALGIAAAAAIAGLIASFVKFGEGGIVDRPTFGMLGETGDTEAVINLDSPKGKRQLSDAMAGAGGGGGGHTINIYGTFIEGDPGKWDRLMTQQVLPWLERKGRKTRQTRGKVY